MNQSRKTLFWTDLRSKRNITTAHLSHSTYENFQFYDPLLSPNVGVISVAPGIDWFSQAQPNSWQLNLHSFRFADYWVLQYLNSNDSDILQRLSLVVVDYLEKVWQQKDVLKLSKSVAFKHVFSDTAVANRAAVLALLLGQAAEGMLQIDQAALREALIEHVLYAASDDHYNSNNHGLFNDLHLLLGLINAPDEPILTDIAPRVLERLLNTYLEKQVNVEGIHLEHTPSYAVLWVLLGRKTLEILEKLADQFPALAAEGVNKVRKTMQLVTNNLWWFTKPNGELVNFGEQGRTDAAKWIPNDVFQPGIMLFPSSGYSFSKTEESYLGFVAAYHATKTGRKGYRAASHKQRDELHLVWFDAGGDILVDPGLRAYDFGPERFYATSKAAHNTVCIGKDDFIGDSILEYMDKTEPYGGGIKYANRVEVADGSNWYVMIGEDPLLYARKIKHLRTLLFQPGRWLIVLDSIDVDDEQIAEWNFHFAERWKSTGYNSRAASFKSESNILQMTRFTNSSAADVDAKLSFGSFTPVRGWRFSGGPIAVPNLYYREKLEPGKQHLRGHAFQIAQPSTRSEDGIIDFGMGLLETGLSIKLNLIEAGMERSLIFDLHQVTSP